MQRKNNTNNEISYYDEKWPDKMVILITSHGSFSKVDDDDDNDDTGHDGIQTTKVPAGIRVNYFYASAHGSVTAFTEMDAKRMFDFIKNQPILTQDTKPILSQYSDIMMNAKDKFFNNLTRDIKNYKLVLQNSRQLCVGKHPCSKLSKYRQQINEAMMALSLFVSEMKKERKTMNTIYSKGFTYCTYNELDILPNKEHHRRIRDIIPAKNVGSAKYDYAIRLMNLKNQPDMLDLLQTKRYKRGGDGMLGSALGVDETPNITTQQIIELCHQHGVKEITFIDSSCGQLNGNDRELRNIRRSIHRQPNVEFLLNKPK